MKRQGTSENSLENYLTFKDIKSYNNEIDDIYYFKQAFPSVNFRYYVEPTKPIAHGLGILDFKNETSTWPMQMQGREDGANAVSKGEGFFFDKMDEWH
jgi:hypothetical protein